ncbi:hypothetical protein FKW77_010140 [Venturia effusa]|uniref:BTB domain-containing protein n=1 Tax=Venturia effusa TaxID=50376 RepID=A0A517L296_9PEZI|nr:hypothetical protein FKW77_010140 [Venturia effusa]
MVVREVLTVPRKSLMNKKYTDMYIRCKDGTHFEVHKAVVCSLCKFFENACKKEWEQKIVAENGTEMTLVNLADDEPFAVNAMIAFFYYHDYQSSRFSQNAPERLAAEWKASEARCHIKIYVLADKFGIEGLKGTALAKLMASLSSARPPDFHDVIRDVYNNTQDTDPIRTSISHYASRYASLEFAADDGKFDKLVVELPEFGRDLAKVLYVSTATNTPSSSSNAIRGLSTFTEPPSAHNANS